MECHRPSNFQQLDVAMPRTVRLNVSTQLRFVFPLLFGNVVGIVAASRMLPWEVTLRRHIQLEECDNGKVFRNVATEQKIGSIKLQLSSDGFQSVYWFWCLCFFPQEATRV
jgi:hypothetical protein